MELIYPSYGVLGVECSNHSVPTIFFNDLARFGSDRALLFLGFDHFGHRWVTVSKKLVKCHSGLRRVETCQG